MATTTIELRAGSGATAAATADVRRYGGGARAARAAVPVVLGLLGAGSCLMVPGPHLFITTWLLPLIGIMVGRRASRTTGLVQRVTGDCPGCGKKIELLGGTVTGPPLREACPRCREDLQILVPAETKTA